MEIIKAPIYVKLTEEERKALYNACVREAFYTTHKTIVFKKGE